MQQINFYDRINRKNFRTYFLLEIFFHLITNNEFPQFHSWRIFDLYISIDAQ